MPLMPVVTFSMVSAALLRFRSVQRPPSVLLCQRYVTPFVLFPALGIALIENVASVPGRTLMLLGCSVICGIAPSDNVVTARGSV